MSRSALTRHALHKATRPSQPHEEQDESSRHVKQDELPIYGNQHTYNLNTLLHQNIQQSAYFHELYNLKTYHEVVDEIYYRVDHAEPLSPGTARIPSTCFCLLHKFFVMRLTTKQMQGLLRHTDSPYIRVIGFLYLRYTCDPEKLWSWYEPYLDDPEEFNASSNPNVKTTMGEWLVGLLSENNYFSTILPRIPKKIQDSINVKLLLQDRKKERAKANASIVEFLKPGTKIRAMYADEDNEPAMYDAVIDSVEENNQYWVSFPEYGNTEKVSLGDIEFTRKGGSSSSRAARSVSRSRSRDRRDRRPSGSSSSRRSRRSSSRDRRRSRSSSYDRNRSSRHRHRSRSRNRSRSPSPRGGQRSRGGLTDDLMQQVRDRERRKAEAVGRDYAARPASYKGSLSLKLDRFTTRKRSPTKRSDQPAPSRESRASRNPSPEPSAPTEKLSKEAEDRMRKLRDMYGDASTKARAQEDSE